MDIENTASDAKQSSMGNIVDRLTDTEKRFEQVCAELGRFNDRMLGVQPPEASGETAEKAKDPSHIVGVLSVKLSHLNSMLSYVERQLERLSEIG